MSRKFKNSIQYVKVVGYVSVKDRLPLSVAHGSITQVKTHHVNYWECNGVECIDGGASRKQ